MKSIYFKNFMATVTMVVVSFIMVAVAFLATGRSYIIKDRITETENSVAEVAKIAGALNESGTPDTWTLGMTLTAMSKSTGSHVFVTDSEGTVISCSDPAPGCEHMGTRVDVEVLEEVLEEDGFVLNSTDLNGFYDDERMAAAKPVYASEGKLLGFAFVTRTEGEALNVWRAFLGIAAMITAGVFGLVIAMAYIYSRSMAKPLDEMSKASAKFARGDFSVRVKQTDDPDSEMGALIESFNSMADSLESAEKRRSEFISNISHELRTPMTTISGFADGILDGTIPKSEQDKYLVSIRDETLRLSRLVRDMLEVSRSRSSAADKTRRTVFDVNELILRTMLSFEPAAVKKSLDVDPQLPENAIMVKADKDAITQVIYNLMDNAVKFAAEGSCITIRLYKDGGKAYISIKDCGETIPPDDLPFIFDRFHKSDRSRSIDKNGVGLGLYLVKSIINSHDEDIAVRSENGETEFVFTLTLA